MAQDYLDDIVQKIVTRCDLGGFYELNVAIEDATKKARSLSRSLGNLVTGEQKVEIAKLNNERTKTLLLLEQERNAVTDNRLELQRLTNELRKNNNETKIATQERDKQISSDRLQKQLSKERTAQIKKETVELKRQNVVRKESNWLYRQAGRLLLTYFSFHTLRGIVETGSRIQLVQKSIEGLTKSTQDWDYIQQQAFKTGTEIEVVAKGYRNFYSSAKMAGFDKTGIQSMYADTLLATRSIGASTQQTEGALLALEQMLSKGTVSMEELRRQLGNAIPGAFEIGAKAMNMTTKEFNDFVKKGQLASNVFVPKFIKALKETYADGFKNIEQTVSVAQIRLSNSWKLLQAEIMSGETGKSFASALNTIRELIDSPEFKQLIIYLGVIFKWVVKIFSFLIQNMRLVLMLFGIRGFYGLLAKNVLLFRIFNMNIGRAIGMLILMGKHGNFAFGGLTKSARVFMSTLFRILLPLLLIEDVVLGIGQRFFGWNVRSLTGDLLMAQKDIAEMNKVPPSGVLKIPDAVRNDPKFKPYIKKLDKGELLTKDEMFGLTHGVLPATMSPVPKSGAILEQTETNNNNISMGDVTIKIEGATDSVATANVVKDVLLGLAKGEIMMLNTEDAVG